MPELDFSSYPRPAAPTSLLDNVQKLGSIQQQALGVNQQKLDQANQALGYMTRAMGSIGPNGTKKDYLQVGQNAVKMGLVPQEMLNTYIERLTAAKTPQDFYNEVMTSAASHQETINYHLGQPGTMENGQTIQPTLTSPKPGFGVRSSGPPIQRQIPPGAPTIDPNSGAGTLYGAQPPDIAPGSGAVAAPPPVGGLPVARSGAFPVPGNSNNFGGKIISTDESKPDTFANRFAPRGPATSLPPGQAEAEQASGLGSGEQLAKARTAATGYQRDIFPLMQAIPALEKLGTKGTGPGTETINNIKSFILSNVPGVTEKSFEGLSDVASFDKVHKYLTDFVNQTGNSGTNDKLAAAFAGNPSTRISNAAAVDVAKSALALRNMQQAQLLEFEKQKLPANQFSKWVAKRTNELDPRAFGVHLMTADARKKLKERLKKIRVKKHNLKNRYNLLTILD
jgi:hypothetical protein